VKIFGLRLVRWHPQLVRNDNGNDGCHWISVTPPVANVDITLTAFFKDDDFLTFEAWWMADSEEDVWSRIGAL
jgi:hypothetical protein